MFIRKNLKSYKAHYDPNQPHEVDHLRTLSCASRARRIMYSNFPRAHKPRHVDGRLNFGWS